MGVKGEPERYRWTTLGQRRLLACPPWLEVWVERVRLPDGRVIDDFYRVQQPDYAMVVPTAADGCVLALWHYKLGAGRVHLSLPAGYLAPGDGPLEAAQRELLEETGYEAEHWRHLGSFCVDGNRGCGQAHFYLASGLRAVQEPDSGDHEEMELEFMLPEMLRQHLAAGRVGTLAAAAAIGLGLDALGG
jgi:ADP-ribose pyrophosphatase